MSDKQTRRGGSSRDPRGPLALGLPTRGLLHLLLERICEGPHPRHFELDALCEQLLRLDAEHVARVELLAAPLRGPLQALLEGVDPTGPLGKAQRGHLRTVLRRMHCIIENATSHHALAPEHLHMGYSRVNLADVVRVLCGRFEALAAAREIGFEVKTPPQLVAQLDAGKIEAVVTTLLFNAFKQTPERGIIVCALELDAPDEHAVLRVSDGGPSIPPVAAETLFDRLRESDRGSVLHLEGMVLNLGTARDFVALHGGTLAIVQRCTFRVRLPQFAPTGMEVDSESSSPGRLAALAATVAERELHDEAALGREQVERRDRGLVLIVGGNRSLHRLVAESLHGDYDAASAFDAETGLRRACELCPDLVVADIGTPATTGEGLVTALRQRTELAHVPILVLTGADDPLQQVRLLEGGAQDVLRKPFLLPELRARVRNLVSTQRALSMLNSATARHESDLVTLAGQVTRDQQALRSTLEQLQVARELAENANRIKSNFLRMVTHELKTPITALQLHLRLLEREPGVSASERFRQGLAHIERSSLRLLHLVDTVLEWARVESGRCEITPEEFDLEMVVADVVAELKGYAQQKGVALFAHVRAGPLSVVTSDRRLVRLVVLNLVTRALQVTEEGTIEVEVLASRGEHQVRVCDDGPAISADDRAEIFEPLGSDRDVRWREGGGSGLGLCVVRDIAHALEADIVLEPSGGGGNVLTLHLPSVRAERMTGTFARPAALESPVEPGDVRPSNAEVVHASGMGRL